MIDENKLIEEIKERIEIYEEDYQAFRKYSGDRKTIDIAKLDECTEIIELIKKQPKADASPIVHGEWMLEAHKEKTNYSGAKMDGKEKKNENLG